MDVSVGTFNLNNLFSRFNFEAQVDEIVEDDPDSGLTATYTFNDPERFRLRTYQGRLVHGKNPADQDTIAARIASMDLDVLCAQEVEDIDTLRFFAAQHLDGRYLGHPSALSGRCQARSHAKPYPRPTYGILVAITVMVATLASRGRLAM